jgi:hypothetical protein
MRRLKTRQPRRPYLSCPDARCSQQDRAGALVPTWTPPRWSMTHLSGSIGATQSRDLIASAALVPQGRQRAAAEPIERALQNVGGRVLIDHSGAAGARHIGRDQLALDRGG